MTDEPITGREQAIKTVTELCYLNPEHSRQSARTLAEQIVDALGIGTTDQTLADQLETALNNDNAMDFDIDHPVIDIGVEALFGHHPERGGAEKRQAVFSVLYAAIKSGYMEFKKDIGDIGEAGIMGLIAPPSDNWTGDCPCGCGVKFVDGKQVIE